MRNGPLMATMVLTVGLSACQVPGEPTPSVVGARPGATNAGEPAKVTLMLDWVPNTNHTGIFHATCQGEVSWYGFARRLLEATGYGGRIEPITTAEWGSPVRRPGYAVLENRRLGRLGLDAMPPWGDALDAFLRQSGRRTPPCEGEDL